MSAQAVELLYATGHWLHSRERHRDAAEMFRLMTLTRPEDERGWLALGACHEAVGQVRLAIELYRVALIAAPPAVRCEIARGRALRALDAFDDAALAFETAHDLAVTAGESELAVLALHELRAA